MIDGSQVLVTAGIVLAFALNGAVIFTILDVKGASWMQRRPGPLHVGLRGFIFPLAEIIKFFQKEDITCLLYTSPSPRDMRRSRMPSSA